MTNELEYQRIIDEIKRELNSRFDFSIRRWFEAIDKAFPYNSIDRNEIRDFVKQYFIILNDDELDAIIRRWDTDEDELLSEIEFKEVIKHKVVSPVATKFIGRYFKPIERRYARRREEVERSPREKYWKSYYDRFWDDLYYKGYTRRYSPERRNWRRFSPLRYEVRASSPWLRKSYTVKAIVVTPFVVTSHEMFEIMVINVFEMIFKPSS